MRACSTVAYEESGAAQGWPVVLLHGFPYDVHAYDAVAPRLAAAGARVIVPYLRGYGPTRFRDARTPRSGEQAALGADLRALLDALGIARAVLAGYDWGGRAACVVAALWPGRCAGLVTANGYNIQDIAKSAAPAAPEAEHRNWYQFYFHTERGRAGLARNRGDLARLLWRLWSPEWRFDDATFARTAATFDNPDFLDVVIHSYRHRYALAAGDPACADIERALAAQPPIAVPTISLDGGADGVTPARDAAAHARHFTGPFRHDVLPGIGHNIPQEAPEDFAAAVLAVRAGLEALAPAAEPGEPRPARRGRATGFTTADIIRPAGIADLDAIRRIVARAYAKYVGRIGKEPGPMLDDYAAHIRNHAAWVVDTGGAVTGLLVLLPRDGHLLLDNVAIDPAHHGSGLGGALMRFAEAEASRRGYGELRLYTHATMTENLAMYPALGWQETGRGEEAGYRRVFFSKAVRPSPVTG